MKWIMSVAMTVSLCACGGGMGNSNSSAAGSGAPDVEQAQAAALDKLKVNPQDLASPDQAVQTFIKWRNADRQANCYFDSQGAENPRTAAEEYALQRKKSYLSFFTGPAEEGNQRAFNKNAQRCLSYVDKFSADIREVKLETPVRAIVIANLRNVGRVPEGAEIEDFQKKKRTEGENFKYQLSKVGPVWKIAQVYRYDEYIKHDWVPSYDENTGQPQVPWLVTPD